MIGRAITAEQKRECVETLFDAWLASPSQRLGQLIVNALGMDPFHVEDDDFAEAVRAFAAYHKPSTEQR